MLQPLLLAYLTMSAFSIIPTHFPFKEHLTKQPASPATSVTTGYLSQKLDHFSNDSQVFFTQQYFYTERLSVSNQKVAFLYVNTEGNEEIAVMTDERSPVVKAAKRFGAQLFALKHRYYGASKPNFQNFDASALRYLTSRQAIQDILSFIKYANTQFNMNPDVRWVLWGTGYGGILAAEARKTDPVAVSGAISSSAPLRRLYDFWQFNDFVGNTLMQIGGSNCYGRVQQGFADIRQAMKTTAGRSQISDLFQLNPRLDQTQLGYNDIQMFYTAIIGPFQEIVQFNNDFNISITDMCTIIANSSWTNMEVVRQAYVYLSTTLTGSVQPMTIASYQKVVNDLKNDSVSSPFVENRMWTYQICTELGWFPTTNNNEQGLFGAVVPTSIYINQCSDIFPDASLTATSIRDSIVSSDSVYTGTNVVFTNGFYDPWSVLGQETSRDFSVVAYVIPGASYLSDFFPGDSDNQYIQKAHDLMIENINIWVNGPKSTRILGDPTVPWTPPQLGGSEASELQSSKVFSRTLPRTPSRGIFHRRHLELLASSYPAGFEQGTFRQRQDHFDNLNVDFFQQKFYKNSQWARPGGPNFLMIGGQEAEGESWVLNEKLPWLISAQKYGATVYLLEHRFYGDSLVGNNTNLNLLSSLQVLYDSAEFIKAINYKTQSSTPWITFGRSFPLSAWTRAIFPDLVTGAVSSSGAILAKTDFFEYLMVMETSIRKYDNSCADRIKSGFDEIRGLFLTSEGRQDLSKIFQLLPGFSENVTETDQHFFFSNLYSNFQLAVQFSGDNSGPWADGYGIPEMCRFMTGAGTPLDNIVAFNAYMTSFNNGGGTYTGMGNNYTAMIYNLKNSKDYGEGVDPTLLWTWQTCTEYGGFQSADSGSGLFGSPVPVSFLIQMCMDLFGNTYDRSKIDSLIDFTNYKYGGRDNFKGSNVVFINGNIDPYHVLGLFNSPDSSVVSYLIDGSSHCADMFPARDSDVPGLKVARDLVDQNIGVWLGGQVNITTTTATTTSNSTSYPSTLYSLEPTTTKSTSVNRVFISFCVIMFDFLVL